MPETKVILQYKRECDSWLCPVCDTENGMSLEKCAVCNFSKNSETVILKAWSEAEEGAGCVETHDVPETGERESIFKDDDTASHVESKKSKKKIIWFIVIAALIVLGFFIGGESRRQCLCV